MTREQYEAKYGQPPVLGNAQPPTKGLGTKLGEFSTGFAKGGLQTAIGTAQGLQGLGQRAVAAVDPTRNLQQVREQTGFPSLSGEEAERQNAMLQATSPEEKLGKGAEFLAELFFPAGRTEEVANLAQKGKNLVTSTVDNLAGKTGASLDNLGDRIAQIKDSSIRQRLVDLTGKLDEKTKTALQRTSRNDFENFVKIGEGAMKDDRAITPIEHVGQRFVEGAQRVKNKMSQIGQMKGQVLDQARIAQQDVSGLVKEAALKIYKGAKSLGVEDKKYAQEVIEKLKPHFSNGRLKNVDALIDDIQDGLYKLGDSEKAVQLTDRVTGLIRNSIEGLNRGIQEKAGPTYQKLNKQYSQLRNILNDVNKGVGRKGERSGAFMKRFFSPSDAGTKKLFDTMQKLTGVDYARDARLSKFIMESLGDRRVESLLEQIPKSKSEITTRLFDYVVEKTGVSDPIEAARRYIEQNGKP